MVTKDKLLKEIMSFRAQIVNARATIQQAEGAIAVCQHFIEEIDKAEQADIAKAKGDATKTPPAAPAAKSKKAA